MKIDKRQMPPNSHHQRLSDLNSRTLNMTRSIVSWPAGESTNPNKRENRLLNLKIYYAGHLTYPTTARTHTSFFFVLGSTPGRHNPSDDLTRLGKHRDQTSILTLGSRETRRYDFYFLLASLFLLPKIKGLSEKWLIATTITDLIGAHSV